MFEETYPFSEHIHSEDIEQSVFNAHVYVDRGGFIRIDCKWQENYICLSRDMAAKVHAALGRALKATETRQ